MEPRLDSKEPGNSQLREGPLERMLGRIRRDEYLQQLVTSEAVIAAPSKKKRVIRRRQQHQAGRGLQEVPHQPWQ